MSGIGHIRELHRGPPALYQETPADVIGDRASRYVYGPIKLFVRGWIKTKSDVISTDPATPVAPFVSRLRAPLIDSNGRRYVE